MKIATIGTSWITEKFISACKYSGVEIKYCVSRSLEKAEEFCRKVGAEGYTDSFDTVVADPEIDAVYIASPNVCHYEQSRFFIERGKNVICEKPATTTEEQFRELKALADETGVIYCEAIMSVHTPAFETLKTAVEAIGNIRSANIAYCQLSSKYPAFLDGKNPNIFNPEMHAGCLMDIGVYNLYLVAALFGMPEKIQSDAQFLSSGADAAGTAIFSYPDKTVSLIYSKVSQGFAASEIHGDLGTVQIEAVSQCQGISVCKKDGVKSVLVPDGISRDEIMSGEIVFLRDLIEGKDWAKEKYAFATECALTVRKMCDTIRAQNDFRF